MKIGWSGSDYIISTNKSGSGVDNQLVIQTGTNTDQLKLLVDGTIFMSSSVSSQSNTKASLVMSGGLSIKNTSNATSLTVGGGLTLAGGASISKDLFIGNKLNIYGTSGNIQLSAQNSTGDLLITTNNHQFNLAGTNEIVKKNMSLGLYKLNNNTVGNYELLAIVSNDTCYNINSKAGGTGVINPIQLNVGNGGAGVFLDTSGNVGINTTTPAFTLDVNGTLQANDFSLMNQITIYNTEEAYSETSSGSLTVAGGVGIAKNLFVGGQTTFTSTMEASTTSASVYMAGGLTIAAGQASNYGFGALTVLGGGFIGGELYVQQNLNVAGQINGGAASSSTYAYLTLTATDEAVNLSSGSFLTFGGITIQSYSNAENVSNGGSLLTPGGASIGKDLYIGGNLNNYGIQNYYDNSNELINFYDVTAIRRFSIGRDTASNNLSISRYNGSGTFIEKVVDISNSNGQITLKNSNSSTGLNNASLITIGGITVNCSSNAASFENGGGLTVFGGASISKDLYVGGDIVFLSTTPSTTSSSGALRILGGVGIGGDLNVFGNSVFSGNVSILGTTNSVHSTNTFLSDNIILINSGPSGSTDGGILIERYQLNNDTASGDVVTDLTDQANTYTLPNQSGMTNVQLKVSGLASEIDDYYTGSWVRVMSGFSIGQVRKITGYVATTRILTIEEAWTNQSPTLGDTVNIYSKPYVGLFWNEISDQFEFGSSTRDPGRQNIVLSEYSSLNVSSLITHNTGTTSILTNGGITINNTRDASSSTSGGALNIAGGAGISKKLYVGEELYVNNINMTPNSGDILTSVLFNASNNVTDSQLTQIPNDDSVWGFDMYVSARLLASTNLYSNYHIRGVNKGTDWELITNYVGDSILDFNITSDGIIRYSTQNFSGFTNLTLKYKIIAN